MFLTPPSAVILEFSDDHVIQRSDGNSHAGIFKGGRSTKSPQADGILPDEIDIRLKSGAMVDKIKMSIGAPLSFDGDHFLRRAIIVIERKPGDEAFDKMTRKKKDQVDIVGQSRLAIEHRCDRTCHHESAVHGGERLHKVKKRFDLIRCRHVGRFGGFRSGSLRRTSSGSDLSARPVSDSMPDDTFCPSLEFYPAETCADTLRSARDADPASGHRPLFYRLRSFSLEHAGSLKKSQLILL